MSEWIKNLTAAYSQVAEGKKNEANDLDTDNAQAALKHDCATHVEHAEYGKGECIKGQHTLVAIDEENGYVTHYDVMFEHGIEENVAVEDLKVLSEMSHGHKAKKKNEEMSSKEKMKRGLYNSKTDPVDPKELKGKHADRDDKDIDNDGDVDSSDQYLHKKRKAISKSMKNESKRDMETLGQERKRTRDQIGMKLKADKLKRKGKPEVRPFPFMSKQMKNESVEEVQELNKDTLKSYRDKARKSRDELQKKSQSSVPVDYGYDKEKRKAMGDKSRKRANMIMKATGKIKANEGDEVEMNPKKKSSKGVDSNVTMEQTHPVYARILENRGEHYKKAAAAQKYDDNWSPGAKEMAKDKGPVDDTEEKGHKDSVAAGRAGPKAKPRNGDNKAGDKSVVNPVKDTTK